MTSASGEKRPWLDPELQVTITQDHVCVTGPSESFDSGNHFGFNDPHKAREFSRLIAERADQLEEDQKESKREQEAVKKAHDDEIELLENLLFWNGVCRNCGAKGQLVAKTYDKQEGVDLHCSNCGEWQGWRAWVLQPLQMERKRP